MSLPLGSGIFAFMVLVKAPNFGCQLLWSIFRRHTVTDMKSFTKVHEGYKHVCRSNAGNFLLTHFVSHLLSVQELIP